MNENQIVFANGNRDCEFISEIYSDNSLVRVTLKDAKDLLPQLPNDVKVWIDSGVDSLARGNNLKTGWKDFLKQFDSGETLLENELKETVSISDVRPFVDSFLNKYQEFNPDWVSIPQVPVQGENSRVRDKLNRDFAKSTSEWIEDNDLDANFFLPVIFEDRNVFNSRTNFRRERISKIKSILDRFSPDGLWIVNTKINDENPTKPNQQKRLPGMIEFHEELNEELNEDYLVTAGPYWAMNLILWARNLVDLPSVSVATGYRYYIPGGVLRSPADRICIPSLRRRVKVKPGLKDWLNDSSKLLKKQAQSDADVSGIGDRLEETSEEFGKLFDQYSKFSGNIAHRQVATSYKKWLEEVKEVSPEMRGIYMRQNFSSAEVIGRIVENFPEGIEPRTPGKLARVYMLNCF